MNARSSSCFEIVNKNNRSISLQLDALFLSISIVSFIAAVVTDVLIIVQYYVNCHYIWMLLTLGVICMSSPLIQLFSIRWYIVHRNRTNYLWVIHIFQLGIWNRYLQLINLIFKPEKSNEEMMQFGQQYSDISKLKLFESFTKSAPQLILQLYILMTADDSSSLTVISAAASAVSLCCGMLLHSKARTYPQHFSWSSLWVQFCWHMAITSARVLVMVLFATAYGFWLIFVIGFHCITLALWVTREEIPSYATWWEECLHRCVVGVIYCFCFFNFKDGSSWHRGIIYYVLTFVHTVCLLILYYFSTNRQFSIEAAVYVILIGLTSILLFQFFIGKAKISHEMKHKDQNTSSKKQVDVTEVTTRKIEEPCPSISVISFASPSFNSQSNEGSVSSTHCRQSGLHTTSFRSSCISPLNRSYSLKYTQVLPGMCHSHCISSSGNTEKFPKAFASHFKTVNYNFRTAVAFGKQLHKFHCSCLVLCEGLLDLDTSISSAKNSKLLPDISIGDYSNFSFPPSVINISESSIGYRTFHEQIDSTYNLLPRRVSQFLGSGNTSCKSESQVHQLERCVHSSNKSWICPVESGSLHNNSSTSHDCAMKLSVLYDSVSA